MAGTCDRTWFDTLRRDGKLFALAATLLLLVGTVPATHHSALADGVICTVEGVAPADAPAPPGQQCPLCLVSAFCQGGLAVPAQQSMPGAFPTMPAGLLAPPRGDRPAGDKSAPGIVSIRAPPAA